MARVVIAAGGTGGHLYPALALADVLRDRGHSVAFVGGDRLEARLVPEAGFELHKLPAVGLPRAVSPGVVVAGGKLAWSVISARRLLRALSPGAVVGMGGYASVAPALAARVPVVLHEQNARLTLGNRIAAWRADALALSLPLMSEAPRIGRVELTGNPLRRPIRELARCEGAERWRRRALARQKFGLHPDALTLLAFGGSQGALALNDALPRALPHGGLQVLHIAGPDHAQAASQAWQPGRAHVVPYVDAMEDAYAAADVVVSRSGATTVAELCALGLPAVLVPYPYGNYQEANARSLEVARAARVVSQPEPDFSVRLGAQLSRLLSDDAERARTAAAARDLGRPDAHVALAGLVENVMKRPSGHVAGKLR